MQSLSHTYLKSLRFSARDLGTIQEIGANLGRQDLFKRQTPETLRTLQTHAIIESSESSNRLEGIVASRKAIEGLVRKDAKPKNRSEQEIAGYRDGLRLIHDSHEGMDFTPNIILQLHRRLYGYLPQSGGTWKPVDNEIIERNPETGEMVVRFKPLAAVAVPQAMDDLCSGFEKEINAPEGEALVLVPLAILDFLCIHPFADGNGRVSRLLTLLLLYQSGYEVGRFISLERVFEDARDGYYETLHAASQGWHEGEHDAMPWVRYFWGVLLKAYQEFEERVGSLGTHKGAKSDFVRQAVQARIGTFSTADIGNDCPGVNRNTIKAVLQAMRKEGLIRSEGKGRGARWVLED